MKTFFRLLLIGCTALAALKAGSATAADFPTKPVRIVVGFAAGGPSDIQARMLAQWLEQKMGQQFIVENKVGAGSNIATESVVNAEPNGYTLLLITTANAINVSFFQKLPFNFLRDIAPVAGLGRFPFVIAMHPSVPASNVAEFIAYAKANPGKVSFASAGVGGANHLTGELFNAMAGTKILHVPYKGNAAAYLDLIAGRVQIIFADLASSMEYIKSGRLKALAVTSLEPLAPLPGVPTVAAVVPGFEAAAWLGFGAPRGTPADVVDKLNREINAGLNDAAMRRKFREMESEPLIFTPAQFGNHMATEAKRWAQAIEASGVKGD